MGIFRRRFYFSFVLALVAFTKVWAQPSPCESDEMTSTCTDACVVCDIDGFTGRNDLTDVGQTFDGFCTNRFHNMSYIAFIAGTEDLTLTVSVSNCTIDRGIEVGIFESLDCETFSPVTDCNTDVPADGIATFSNNVPLVIGQHYYLIMDGSRGDICDWTFSVIEGSTAVGALTTSGVIEGPAVVCPANLSTYFTLGDIGATFFDWTIDGVLQTGNLPAIDLSFPSDGDYQVCVTASNVCDQAPPSCRIISVQRIQDTYLADTVCITECVEVAGEEVCIAGSYEFTVTRPDGCDSTIFFDLVVLTESVTPVTINLCLGDTFFLEQTPYLTTGIHQHVLPSSQGCDSLIDLSLQMIDCELIGSINSLPPTCNGDFDASISFSVVNGVPPYTYEWQSVFSSAFSGSGSVSSTDDIIIDGLAAGLYEINISDSFGNDLVILHEVTDPAVLLATTTAVLQGGYHVSCYGATDGQAQVLASGGVPPYSYLWSSAHSTEVVDDIGAGGYTIEITDSNGCVFVDDVVLEEPAQILAAVNYIDPSCDGQLTGSVEMANIDGGQPPFVFALDNGDYSTSSSFSDLGPGQYTFSVIDDNGCTMEVVGELVAPQIPLLTMPQDQVVDLGCTVALAAQINDIQLSIIEWTNEDGSIECINCIETVAQPINDITYTLTVTSVDGCTTTAGIGVVVEKYKDLTLPNIFSPNGDWVNDVFFITMGKSIATVQSFDIYDRWGSLVFTRKGIDQTSPDEGWDGTYLASQVRTGVYVWTAEVLYLDNSVVLYNGAITVVR